MYTNRVVFRLDVTGKLPHSDVEALQVIIGVDMFPRAALGRAYVAHDLLYRAALSSTLYSLLMETQDVPRLVPRPDISVPLEAICTGTPFG